MKLREYWKDHKQEKEIFYCDTKTKEYRITPKTDGQSMLIHSLCEQVEKLTLGGNDYYNWCGIHLIRYNITDKKCPCCLLADEILRITFDYECVMNVNEQLKDEIEKLKKDKE